MTTHEPSLSPLLELRNASLSVQGRTVLHGINLHIHPGESVAVIGPNGAGKSSLLKALAGELPVSHECYRFNGQPYRHWTLRQLAERRAVLPQQLNIPFPMRVDEVVALGLPARQRGNLRHPLVRKTLADLEAAHLLHRRFPSLSGGEQQRVQLARIMAQIMDSPAPATLLLDECTSALDPAHQHQVLQRLTSLAEQGHALLWTVHDLNLASRYADRIIVMKNGSIVADDTPWNVLTPALLTGVFGIDVDVINHEGIPHVVQRGRRKRKATSGMVV